MNAALSILKRSGKSEEFNKNKLQYSLICSGATKEQSKRITAKVYASCTEGMSSIKIFNHAFRLLKKESKVIAAHYSMPKAILQLGPDGFHFEKFIASLFNAQGFSVKTDQIIKGHCVQHELDVIAKKKDQKQNIYCECKFHNKLTIKNDIKTALYVNSRALDLKENPKCDITEFWLISNTKFTKDTIEYAKCVGLHLLGPNYPQHNALADLAKKTHIHPITSLTSIKKSQAREFLKKGIVLTHDIKRFPQIFESINLSTEQRENILSEVEALMRNKNGY